jgi:pimeloyl-ACP methyl ester carboxylesterase
VLGALVVGLATLVYSDYRQEIHAARARVSSGSRIVNTRCGPIEYAVAGSGPAVLVIHGAGGGFDQGLELALPLTDRGFQVIAVSRFGYLRTTLPADASPEAQAEAHACLLDELKLSRVAVIGGSAGAPSAMQLCLRHPERCSALVLLFPMAFAPDRAQLKPPAFFMFVIKTTLHSDFLFWAATKLVRDTLLKTILATPPGDFRNASTEEQARALSIMRHILPVSLREQGIWNDATVSPALPRYDLERIGVPTLLISAEDDLYGTFNSAHYTAEHIPGARFVGYLTGGHLLLGHWKEAGAEVAGFLLQTETK